MSDGDDHGHRSGWAGWVETLQRMDPFGADMTLPLARMFRHCHLAATLLGIAGLMFGTVPTLGPARHGALLALAGAAYLFFLLEFVFRVVHGARTRLGQENEAPVSHLRRLIQVCGGRFHFIVDALSVGMPLALPIGGIDPSFYSIVAVCWSFKLPRHATGLDMLGRVIVREQEALLSVFAAFGILLLTAATLAYLAERNVQPLVFSDVPEALWWAITTITTTGYGDAVPQTFLGRIVAGSVMVCGIGVFALWAGILATGFSAELRRRDFLRTWDLVATVPMFQRSGSGLITEAAGLLRPRILPGKATVTVKGSPGDSMFFIVEGEVELELEPRPIRLRRGAFFGEIALLSGEPRSTTIRTSRPTTLLVLDIADFRGLAVRYPELTAIIEEEAGRRVAMNNAAVQAASGSTAG